MQRRTNSTDLAQFNTTAAPERGGGKGRTSRALWWGMKKLALLLVAGCDLFRAEDGGRAASFWRELGRRRLRTQGQTVCFLQPEKRQDVGVGCTPNKVKGREHQRLASGTSFREIVTCVW